MLPPHPVCNAAIRSATGNPLPGIGEGQNGDKAPQQMVDAGAATA
jgi:hypothetical protein